MPAIYSGVYTALRTGGILLNGDTMRFRLGAALAVRAAAAIDRRHRDAPRDGERWEELLGALAADPWLGPLYAERERRFAGRRSVGAAAPTLADHEAAARAAGFGEVATIWQHLDFRVLLALRPSDPGREPASAGAGG